MMIAAAEGDAYEKKLKMTVTWQGMGRDGGEKRK